MTARRIAIVSFRGVFYALGGLLLLLAVLTLTTARHGDRALYPPAPDAPQVTVYVEYNWLHANIVLPTDMLMQHSAVAAEAIESMDMAGAPWMSMGWGDQWYYRERGKTPRRYRDFARSMLRPRNPSVILIDPVSEAPTPETTGRHVVRLTLGEPGFARLAERLDSSFLLQDGAPVVRGRGRPPGSWFFASQEGADLLQVCNHWIGRLLNAAGVPVTPVTDSVTYGLAGSLQWRAGAQQVPGDPDAHVPQPETPPAHSGTYDATSPAAREISPGAAFETYRIAFRDTYIYDTAPIRLSEAGAPAGSGEASFAALMEVAPESLVEIRRVVSAEGTGPGERLCGEAPAQFIVTGFRELPDETYEIALAAFRGETPPGDGPLGDDAVCGVYQYSQR